MEQIRTYLREESESRNIILNFVIGSILLVPINVVILFVFPFIEPFLSALVLNLITPYIPPPVFDLLAIFLFIVLATLVTFGILFGLLTGLNILGFLLIVGLRNAIKVKVKRTEGQKKIIRLKTIILLFVVGFVIWLFYVYQVLSPTSFIVIFSSASISEFVTNYLALLASLHITLNIYLLILVTLNYGIGMGIDFIYYFYRKNEGIILEARPIYEYVDESV